MTATPSNRIPAPEILVDLASVSYGGVVALSRISLRLAAGSLTALIGPNGAGKSTLLKAITGQVPLSAGTVRIGGRAAGDFRQDELARTVAVVPQDISSPFEYRVLELVLMGRSPHLGVLALESAADVDLARAALDRLGLLAIQDRPLGTLSGGERQRVVIARALAQDAPVLLLDEPTAHLDLAHQRETLSLLRELAGEGRTVLVALHDLNLASLYCPSLALLAHGKLVTRGTPQEVLMPGVLAEAYGTEVLIIPHPISGQPMVLPASPG